MTKEELKIWFLDKYNSCYSVIDSDNPKVIYMIYDIDYIRAKKLANILNKEVEYPTEVKGIYLFQINYKNKYIICDTDEILSFLEFNYNKDFTLINILIKDFLKEYNRINELTPIWLDLNLYVIYD